MTKQIIVRQLLERGHITIDEATVLLENKTVTVPYHINNNDYWYSTIS